MMLLRRKAVAGRTEKIAKLEDINKDGASC
jgi:hypothetical protein